MYLPRTCVSTTDVTAQVKLLKFYCVSVLEGKKTSLMSLAQALLMGMGNFDHTKRPREMAETWE